MELWITYLNIDETLTRRALALYFLAISRFFAFIRSTIGFSSALASSSVNSPHPTVSPKQKLWLEELKRAGIDGYVAYGATEAIEIVRDELDKLRKEDDNGEVF